MRGGLIVVTRPPSGIWLAYGAKARNCSHHLASQNGTARRAVDVPGCTNESFKLVERHKNRDHELMAAGILAQVADRLAEADDVRQAVGAVATWQIPNRAGCHQAGANRG